MYRALLSFFFAAVSLGWATVTSALPRYLPYKTTTFGHSSGSTYVRGGVFDGRRNLYVTGGSHTTSIQAQCPRIFTFGPRGGSDAFVMKYNQRGVLKWCLIIGGTGYDRFYGIDVLPVAATASAPAHNIIAAYGRAGPGMPTTPNAIGATFIGGVAPGANGYGAQDGYVVTFKDSDIGDLDASVGPQLLAGTYLGGDNPVGTDNAPTRAARIMVRGGEPVLVAFTGVTGSSLILSPHQRAVLTNAPHGAPGDVMSGDVLVTMMRLSDLSGIWGTFVGGSGSEMSSGSLTIIPPDSRYSYERPVILTTTNSPDITFPQATAPLQAVRRGLNDFLIAVLNPFTGAVTHQTLYGGSHLEFIETHNVAAAREVVPGEGSRIILGAQTLSADFPFVTVPWQNGHGGNGGAQNYQGDCVVASLNADLRSDPHTFAVPFGGSGGDGCEGVTSSPNGRYIVVSGATNSPNLPVTSTAASPNASSTQFDSFVAMLSRGPKGLRLVYSSYRGGSGDDFGRWIAIPRNQVGIPQILATGGQTKSTSFPGVPASYPKSGWDGLVSFWKR